MNSPVVQRCLVGGSPRVAGVRPVVAGQGPARRLFRRGVVLGVAWIALAASFGGPDARAGDDPTPPAPFPFAKTTILRDEHATYFVEGRVRIPKGTEITVLRGVRIEGRGKGATIEVEGGLKIHGAGDLHVEIDGVTIEPRPVFDAIKISMTRFIGGSGIRTAKDAPCRGYFMLELMGIDKSSSIDIEMRGGSAELATVQSDTPVRLKAVDDPSTRSNQVKFEVRGCQASAPNLKNGKQGLTGGITLESANEMVVRLSRLGGDLVRIADWRKTLIFDGNKVDAKTLEFDQPVSGRYRTAQFVKCDVYAKKVTFRAPPAKPGTFEDFPLERWYFSPAGPDRKAVADVIDDGTDDPSKNSTRVNPGKLGDRALELGGEAPGK